MTSDARTLRRTDRFVDRHVGPRAHEIQEMLETLGLGSLEELVDEAVPASIRFRKRAGHRARALRDGPPPSGSGRSPPQNRVSAPTWGWGTTTP
jgi:hypothetical protein